MVVQISSVAVQRCLSLYLRVAIAWLLVALCAGWAALRLLGLERGYPLVPLVAYTPLVAAAAVVVVGLAALLRQRGAALVAALLAVVLVVTVAPRALGGPSTPEGAAGPELRVLSANMHGTGSAEALVALVRRSRADVLSVQELTPGLARRLEAAGLGELVPEQILEPGGRAGIGLYSRLPLAAGSAPGARRNPLLLAGAAAEVGAGLEGTWPANRRFPLPVAIDHVLADARCGVRAFSVHGVPRTDHRAVLAVLVLPRG